MLSLIHILEEYTEELRILGVTLPKTEQIPMVRFDRAKELVAEKYNRKIRNPYDLEPEEESLIGQYFKEEYDADFVFVTHYPSKKRPFYAMDDPADPTFTLSFDLLFHGLEITTGGQPVSYTHLDVYKRQAFCAFIHVTCLILLQNVKKKDCAIGNFYTIIG